MLPCAFRGNDSGKTSRDGGRGGSKGKADVEVTCLVSKHLDRSATFTRPRTTRPSSQRRSDLRAPPASSPIRSATRALHALQTDGT